MIDEIFKYKSANFEKLKLYGFEHKDDFFVFEKDILSGEFLMQVFVSTDGKVSTKVIDKSVGEEYVLHKLKTAVGEFVGSVRSEYDSVLADICEKCFDDDVFKSKQAKEIVDFAQKHYGAHLEFLWKNAPDIAVLRRYDTQKWYAVLFVMNKSKLDKKSTDVIDIVDLHISPEKIEKFVDGKNIFAGYHMNKKHWLTVCLDGSVDSGRVLELLQESFDLAK